MCLKEAIHINAYKNMYIDMYGMHTYILVYILYTFLHSKWKYLPLKIVLSNISMGI